ncbi:MAG: AraC family transcriptional regulator [Variovorax sp.]
MKNPESMIESPDSVRKWDRLAAFFEIYPLSVRKLQGRASTGRPALFLLGGNNGAEAVLLVVRDPVIPQAALAAVEVEFGGPGNPLLKALPDTLQLSANDHPALRATAQAFLLEAQGNRCGSSRALDRLGEVLVLMVMRAAIEAGAAVPGLLAGLAHPELHRVLVAMHDAPAHPWDVDELSDIAGMSRSRFMDLFPRLVGDPPKAYLTRWRLEFGRRELQKRGAKVKAVAARSGFGSSEAFSRAFRREFGYPPMESRSSPSGPLLP